MAKPSGSNRPPKSPPDVVEGDTALDIDQLTHLGKYEIRKKIGAGGMGSVFLAVDTGLKRSVALKVLSQEKARNPTLVKRFKSEAQAAANLRHEHIVMIYEAGEADGFLYIALEYVWGTDVANSVYKRGVMPVKRSLEVVRQMALALQHAHSQGIVHRDIKPANILIRRDGTAKLADLGLARAIDDHTDTAITRAGTTVGTVDYMAPEQARDSKAADVRSDLYSLGCTWYYMLTGEPPFPDGSMTNKLRAHAETPLPDPRAINPKVTEAVFAVMRRMTEKDPRRRYQTPDELLADLENARVANDIVSEAILGDSDDDRIPPARVKKPDRKKAGEEIDEDEYEDRPRSPSAGANEEPVGPNWKPPRQDEERKRERQPSELARAISFYAIVVLLIGGVLGGLGWLVSGFGSAVDGPDKQLAGNPFLAEDEATDSTAAAGNALQGNSGVVHGAAPDVDQRTRSVTGTPVIPGQSIEGQPNANRIGPAGDQPTGRTISGAGTDATGTTIVGSATEPSGTSTSGSGSGSETIGSPGNPGLGGVPGAGGKISGRPGMSPALAAAAAKRRANEDALLPSWAVPVMTPLETPKFSRLVVRRGASENGTFPSLNAALEQVPAEGAIIVLEGRGPFTLLPGRIASRTRVVIQAENSPDSGEPPLVILLPAEGSSTAGLLEVIDTALELQNVHLAHSAASASPGSGGDGALLLVRGGNLTLRNCSLTVTGADAPALAAIRLSGSAEASPGKSNKAMHVLLDQTVVRGDNLTALVVDAPELDVVVRRSLLWSGKAPALRMTGNAGNSPNLRKVRLVSTTVSSSTGAVQASGDPAQQAPTALEWINSLVAAPEGAASPALCILDGGNADQQQQALGKTLTWKSVDTLYTGWKPLVKLAPEGTAAATDVGDWLRVWKDKSAGAPVQFQQAGWPSGPTDGIVRAVQLRQLAPETLGMQLVKTVDGGWPGCAPEMLSVASLAPLDSPFATTDRPQIPAGLFGGPVTAETIRVDLTKDDLGKVLAERKPAHGAQIIASGFGARQSSPIVIQNAWVRLKFEQTEGAPLVLSPRGHESSRSNDGSSPGDGFIVVNNGGLEITDGAFTIPAGERAQMPRWFIHVIDGDLALRNCRIQGPLFASNRHKGLVQWQRTSGRPPARMFGGSHEGYAAFDKCCLFGSGTLIEADMRKRAMFFRNCVLVARDDLLSLNLRGGESEIAAAVDLETTTLSAADSFVKVAAAPLEAPASSPLQVFADRCVFGPPLHSGSQKTEPTLLAYSGPLLATRQLTWSENHCGYAPDITSFLRDESARIEPQDFRGVWLKQWGASHVTEPLIGPQGVVLNKELPQRTEDRAKLEPGDFALYASSRAAKWDGGERPIGAPLAELHFPPIRAASGATPTKTKTTKPAKPTPNRTTKPAF